MPTPTPDLETTGNCYEDAFFEMDRRRDGWLLAHGRPTLQREPFCEYGHAWIEKDNQVVDLITGLEAPRFLYYSVGQIDYRHVMLYTREEARLLVVATEHTGPWEGVDAEPVMDDPPKRSNKSTEPVKPLDLAEMLRRGHL